MCERIKWSRVTNCLAHTCHFAYSVVEQRNANGFYFIFRHFFFFSRMTAKSQLNLMAASKQMSKANVTLKIYFLVNTSDFCVQLERVRNAR